MFLAGFVLMWLLINTTGTVYQNQLLYQTCSYVYKYNNTECQPLLGVERETPEVQVIQSPSISFSK